MFKQGVLRRWFTEGGVKYFKSGALRTITNITRNITEKKKKNSFIPSGLFQRFCSWMQSSFLECKLFHRFFKKIYLIDLELPTLKSGFL